MFILQKIIDNYISDKKPACVLYTMTYDLNGGKEILRKNYRKYK